MSESENKVLRTVYLPPGLDELIRVMAFWEKKTKGDVLVDLVNEGLRARSASGHPTTVDAYINARYGKPKGRTPMKRPRNVRGSRTNG